MTKQEKIYVQAQSGTADLSQAGQAQGEQIPPLAGQISLSDILNNIDDGTCGKPADEFVIEANKELRV